MPRKKKEAPTCPHCERTFKSASGLKRHLNVCKSAPSNAPEPEPESEQEVEQTQLEVSEPDAEPAPAEDESLKKEKEMLQRQMDDALEMKGRLSDELQRLRAQFQIHEEAQKQLEAERDELRMLKEQLLEELKASKEAPPKPEPEPTPEQEYTPPVQDVYVPDAYNEDMEAELDEPMDEPPAEELVEETVVEEAPEPVPEAPAEIPSDVAIRITDLEDQIQMLQDSLGNATLRIDTLGQQLTDEPEEVKEVDEDDLETRLLSIEAAHKKLNDKFYLVLAEIGIGEIIDVSKVPPDILENVYQTILNDVVAQMKANIGPKDIEAVIFNILEGIRMETSGSELFDYDGRKIITRDIAKVVEQRLISAKQVQETYEEFLTRLVAYTYKYTPKNFKAMVNIKSQEYSVKNTQRHSVRIANIQKEVSGLKADLYTIPDKLTAELEQENSYMKERLDSMQEQLDFFNNTIEAIQTENSAIKGELMDKDQQIAELETKLEESKSDVPDDLMTQLKTCEEQIASFEDVQQVNVARFNAYEAKLKELVAMHEEELKVVEEKPKEKKEEKPKEKPKKEEEKTDELLDAVKAALKDGPLTLNQLHKAVKVKINKDELEKKLEKMDGVKGEKAGRWMKYGLE